MKLFKKLSAVAVATVMGCSVFAFAACNPDDGGNGGGNGGNGNGAVSGENAEVINGTLNQEVSALTADINVSINTSRNTYECVDGVKGTNKVTGGSSTDKSLLNIGLKANLEAGNVDVEYKDTEGEGTDAEVSYTYAFVRTGHLFITGGEEKVTDYSKVMLSYMGALKDFMQIPEGGDVQIPEAVSGVLESINIEEELGNLVEGVLGGESYTVMALANSFNALTVANGKATADLNKAVDNALDAVKDFLDGVTLETTVGDILNNATIKGVLTPFINLITPADLVKAVKDNLKAPEGAPQEVVAQYEAIAEMVESVLLEPNANETTWDYIVRVISSQELLDVVNGMLAQMGQGTAAAESSSSAVAIDKTLDKCTLGMALGLGGITEQQFNAMLGDIKEQVADYCTNVTATKLSLETSRALEDPNTGNMYVDQSNETTLENFKIVYSLSNNEITQQVITGKVTVTEGYVSTSENGVPTTWKEIVTVVDVNATITYSASVTLADVSKTEAYYMDEKEDLYKNTVEGIIAGTKGTLVTE